MSYNGGTKTIYVQISSLKKKKKNSWDQLDISLGLIINFLL